MVKPCPNCGAKSVAEARFCRSCGTPLRAASARENDPPVSPQAQTIPLAGEGRATDGLSPEDDRSQAANTTKVGREEIEQILRRVQAEYADIDGEKKTTAPESPAGTVKPQVTVRLAPEPARTTATQAPDSSAALAANSAASAPVVAPQSRTRRRVWPFVVCALLGIGVAVGVWAFIHSRQASASRTNSASGASTIQANDEQPNESEKQVKAEAKPQPEQTVETSSAPPAQEGGNQAAKNMEHPRATRTTEQQRQTSAAQTNTQKVSESSASAAPPSVPSVAPTPAPKINAQQLDADAYYFKGVNTVNGRDPKKLSDGELYAALNYFLRARGGAHSEEAQKYADRLGKEFDRRRKR